MELEPTNGGFLRPFGAAWFILEFLKGNGPEDSKRIDPRIGASMTDIHFEHRSALHRAYARDAVEREEEKRIAKGLPAFSEEDYNERLNHYLSCIPYKLFKMRYSSFTRYFAHLIRLGWVRRTRRTEPSAIQENYPPAPPKVYYQITRKGLKASASEIADPIMTLYHYSREQRSAKRQAQPVLQVERVSLPQITPWFLTTELPFPLHSDSHSSLAVKMSFLCPSRGEEDAIASSYITFLPFVQCRFFEKKLFLNFLKNATQHDKYPARDSSPQK